MSAAKSVESFGEPIWSEEELQGFVDHDDPEIREWALRRLETCADDAAVADRAGERVEDPDRNVAFEAFMILVDRDDELVEPHLESVRSYAERESTSAPTRGRCLGLLAGLGDEAARRELLVRAGEKPCGWDEWLDRNPDSFVEVVTEAYGDSRLPEAPKLLEAVITDGSPELAGPMFDTLDARGHSEEQVEFARRAVWRGGAPLLDDSQLESIEWAGPDEVDSIFRPSLELIPLDRQRTVREAQVEAVAEEDWEAVADGALEMIELLDGGGLQAIDVDSMDWVLACAEALREDPSRLAANPRIRARLASSLELAARRIYGLESVLREEGAVEQKLDVFLELHGFEQSRFAIELESRWNATENGTDARRELAETLSTWVEESSNYRQLVEKLWYVSELDGLDLTRSLDRLIDELTSEEWDEDSPSKGVDLLELMFPEYPAVLRSRAADLLEHSGPTRAVTLDALGRTNASWACDLLLDRLDDLLRYPNDEPDLWQAFVDLGDPRAIDRALEEWRPGETIMARCVCLLAKLAGRFDEIDSDLREDYRNQRNSRDQSIHDVRDFLETDGGSIAEFFGDGPLSLRLQCTECERTYTYEFERLFMDVDADRSEPEFELYETLVPDRIVTCKNCGVDDRQQMTLQARMRVLALLGELARRFSQADSEPKLGERLVPASFEVWEGTTIRRPSEAIDHMREMTERHPDDGEAWLRLGNVCDRYSRLDEAIEAWRRAVEVDEREVEAAFKLVDASGRPDAPEIDAPGYLLEALRRFPQGRIADEERHAAAETLIAMLEDLVAYTGQPTTMAVTSQPRGEGERATIDLSMLDLRRIERWDRLAELFARDAFSTVEFSSDPPETVGRLEQLINSDGALPAGPTDSIASRGQQTGSTRGNTNEPYVKSEEEEVGRNDPCPCGSGRKYKKCCLRKQRRS
ncbi:MAG: SEC-C metal-binding domain-containing protein [Bradymonadaceae bacterium]